MFNIFEPKKNYHQRKLKEALEYLYPDESSRKDLVRKINMEQEFGSWIYCCSGILLEHVTPITDYDLTSVILALKDNLNFEDVGQCNTKTVKFKDSESVNPYKLEWRSYWK